MKYKNYPTLVAPLKINRNIYDQKKLDFMDLHEVWELHKILNKKCGLANERWAYQLKGNEKAIYRRKTEAGIQHEFRIMKEYYWNRPEHDDLNFVYKNGTSGNGDSGLKPKPRLG
jgi:hypothetical protein